MTKVLPEYDEKKFEKIFRDKVIGTVAEKIDEYRLTVGNDDTINTLIKNKKYSELARRWHIKRLPELEVSGKCEMIVCPYCCKDVMLESCRIDHVIPWKKYALYKIIKKACSILSEADSSNRKSISRQRNELNNKLNNLSGEIKKSVKSYHTSVSGNLRERKKETGSGSGEKRLKIKSFNITDAINTVCEEIDIPGLTKICYQDESNMLVCCHECNARKSDRLIEPSELKDYLTKMQSAGFPEGDNKFAKITRITERIVSLRELPYYFYSLIDMKSNLFELLDEISTLNPVLDEDESGYESAGPRNSAGKIHSFKKTVVEDDEGIRKSSQEERTEKYLNGMICLYLTRVYKEFIEEIKRPTAVDSKGVMPAGNFTGLSDFFAAHDKVKKLGIRNFENKFTKAYSPDFTKGYLSNKVMSTSQRVRLADFQLKSSASATFKGKFCFYCLGVFESFAFEIDHISAVMRTNGVDTLKSVVKNSLKNFIPVCKTCNASKSNKILNEELLQEFMIRRWLDAYCLGMENSSSMTNPDYPDLTGDIKNLFSKAIADFTKGTRCKLLFPSDSAGEN